MVTNRQELLTFLKIESETADITHVNKLENWYLENISRQPLYDAIITRERKLALLNSNITEYFNTVAMIPPDEPLNTLTHLGGMNAIQYASKKGYDVYLKSALENNPDAVNQTTKDKLTPLHLAALYGHQISCSILLNYSASLKLESKLGQIPLDLALVLIPSYVAINVRERKEKIIEALIEAYPKGIFHRDTSDNTIAHYAVENNFPFVIEKLIQEKSRIVGFRNSSGHTPLHTAILNKREESIHLLAHVETLLEIADKEARLPIHYAAMYGNSVILQLVMRPAQLNALDANLRTPVMLAAEQGNVDQVKFLIENGADIALTDKYGLNLFHHAVMSLNLELVKWLVENTHININKQDQSGRTPLMCLLNEEKLIRIDTQELVDYLVEVSSKDEIVDNYGKSLREYLPERPGQVI